MKRSVIILNQWLMGYILFERVSVRPCSAWSTELVEIELPTMTAVRTRDERMIPDKIRFILVPPFFAGSF
jgi:hypothetical protein